ncbi:hypothetical protein BOX15_Mlig021751g1 [Macrostomum lignano]|uniref:STAS domain-containing protein n=1 Tax=Macrostomum lignano TaxID=282301 RepID=A0A267F5F7_9PLAT|nr:hypothetical protein BOX15_Mlig021751g1 [Macrostomum lignano]
MSGPSAPSNGGDGLGPPSSNGGGGGSVSRRSRKIPTDLRLQLNDAGIRNDAEATAGGKIASRPAFTEVQLEETFQNKMEPEEQKAHVQNLMDERKAGKEIKDKRAIALGIAAKVFPCLKVLLNYDIREYGPYDLLSGISVGLFIIPQAIAYSLLANMRPQAGFYSAFFAMTIYFIFGTSNHVNMTSQGAVSLLVGEAVRAGIEQVYPNGAGLCAAPNSTTMDINFTTLAGDALSTVAGITTATTAYGDSNTTAFDTCISRDDANDRVALSVTMIAGALQLLLGFMQFGFLSIYLSDPINGAFACGAALHIVSSQLRNILGAPIPTISGNGKFFLYFIEAIKETLDSKVNVPTLVIFVFFFLILLVVKIINERCIRYIRMPIPIDILVLIVSLLMSKFLFWETTLNVAPVGDIQKGFEPPKAPLQEHFTTGSGIILNGIVLGIISYSMSVSVAKTFALRNGYEIDPNQEMIAYGAVNFGMCWFGTFVSASSIACTSLHESLKGKTQVYSLYAISITLIGILVFAPEFSPVPKCVLSAIIIVNLKNMILQVEQLPRLWRTNRYDFTIFLVTLAGILGLDLPIGLLIGVVFSLATVIFRTQAPKAYLLGRLPNTDIYRNIKKHKKAEQIPGLKIFKFDGSLYFASAENYRNRLYRQVAMNPKRILAKAKTRAKREGRGHGEVDLRTDMLQAEGVRRILEVVAEEGSHSVAEARLGAQLALPVHEKHAHFESVAYHSENEETASTVNVFCIILDMSACAFTDAVGIRLLSQIVDDFSKIGVEIYLSGCTWLVRSQLRKASFYDKRSEEGFFVTVHDAVIHALSSFYNELLQDEAKLHEEEDEHHHELHPEDGSAAASTGEGASAEAAPSSGHLHGSKTKQSAAELARDRRRRIRNESWRRNSNADMQSGPTSMRSLQQVMSLPTLAESGVTTPMGAHQPIMGKSGKPAPKFGLPEDSGNLDGIDGNLDGIDSQPGLDNAGFESETKF